MKRVFLCLMLSTTLPAHAVAGRPDVSVRRDQVDTQHVFDVAASGVVQAPPAAVWKVLTNYERMPEFVPDLQSSRVLARNGNEATIEQFGVARFLFMSRDIHLVVHVTEQPMNSIDIGLVTGDMKYYSCRWELVPLPETGGTRVLYSGKLVPNFFVPGMLGASIIRGDIEHMMEAVLARLDRRD